MIDDSDKWFKEQRNSMLIFFGILGAIGALVSISAIIGIIYFIFWCLKHFGVIG